MDLELVCSLFLYTKLLLFTFPSFIIMILAVILIHDSLSSSILLVILSQYITHVQHNYIALKIYF